MVCSVYNTGIILSSTIRIKTSLLDEAVSSHIPFQTIDSNCSTARFNIGSRIAPHGILMFSRTGRLHAPFSRSVTSSARRLSRRTNIRLIAGSALRLSVLSRPRIYASALG